MILVVDGAFLGLILFSVFLCGTSMLMSIVQFLFNNFFIFCVVLSLISLVAVSTSFYNYKTKPTNKLIGGVIFVICEAIRNGMCLIFLLCILYGYILNCDMGLFGMVFGVFALVGDFLVFMLCLCISLFTSASVKNIDSLKLPKACVLNILGTVICFISVKIIINGYYMGALEPLFADYTWVINLIK